MKKVLIIGKGSYLGESLAKWFEQFPARYSVDIVDPKNGAWRDTDFSSYEAVVDFAGIAHINNITEKMRDLFYSVNRELSIELATCAKEHGLKVLETRTVARGEIPEDLEYPIITKSISPNAGGWKSDVHICHSAEELRQAYESILSPTVLIQKYIEKKTSIAWTVSVSTMVSRCFLPLLLPITI